MTRKKGMMSIDLFKKIIDECAESGVDSVKLNLWGESILHNRLIEMIRYAKNNSTLILQFNTNANKMTAEISKGLIDARLDKLTISLDGATKETYEKIRRQGNFENVMVNIENLLNLKREMNSTSPYILLQIIRMKENADEISSFVDYWKERVEFVAVTNIGVTNGSDDILAHSMRQLKVTRSVACAQLWQRLSIFWDGTVTVCCNDYDGFLKIGNINRNRLIDLWHAKELTKLRLRHKRLDFRGLVCEKCINKVEYEQ